MRPYPWKSDFAFETIPPARGLATSPYANPQNSTALVSGNPVHKGGEFSVVALTRRGRRSRLRARSTRVLTVHRTVIHCARAASLPSGEGFIVANYRFSLRLLKCKENRYVSIY